MENASKALLIAGAILIAIVLIGIGIMVISSASKPAEQVGDITASQKIEMFNANFTKYIGTKSGSQVSELLSKVISTNSVTSNHFISIHLAGVTNAYNNAAISTIQSNNINTQKNYTIKMTYADNDVATGAPTSPVKVKGYVSTITITAI